MKRELLPTIVLSALLASCGGGQEPSTQDAEKEAKETLRRIQTGEKITETKSGLDPCEILESGVVAEAFGVEPAKIQYRPGSTRHPHCTAVWRKPNADELESGSAERIMDYMKRKMAAQSKGEAFDEKMPIARPEATASLTIVNEAFDSSAAAVASLESTVATLSKGLTFEVRGEEHTTQVDYDDWMAGVGDKAAWAPKLRELSVAAKGVVFHVSVQVSDTPAENRAQAIELARRIIAEL